MIRTGNMLVRVTALVFTVVALCAGIFLGTVASAYPVKLRGTWENDAWQQYAVSLVSHQLCASAKDGGNDLWPRHVCASILADLTAESGTTMPHVPVSRLFGYPDGGDEYVLTGVGLSSDALPVEASFDMPRGYDETDLASVGNAEPIAVDLPAKEQPSISLKRDAIPGSLLVTILALVGIVAVARRDVVGHENARPTGGADLKVARIISPRHNSGFVGGRIHMDLRQQQQ